MKPTNTTHGTADGLLALAGRVLEVLDPGGDGPVMLTGAGLVITIARKVHDTRSGLPAGNAESGLPDIQADILEAVGQDTLTARELAVKAGYRLNSHFRGVLATMRREGHLKHNERGYYRDFA